MDDVEELVRDAGAVLGRTVDPVRALTGGTHAATVVVRDGTSELVVRRFPAGDDAVARELAVLPRLTPLGDLVPQLVASGGDPTRPVIVTTLVSGAVPAPDLSPARLAPAMAAALARVHALDGTGLPLAPAAPADGAGPLARRAHDALGALDLRDRVLAHRDFWCGNLLWDDDAVTGIVDWSGASSAPRGLDVAWCRQDLVLLGDPDAAALFLREYERHAGVVVADVGDWDVQAAASAEDRVETWAPNYAGIGRRDLTAAVLRTRLDAWNAML